MTQKTLAFCELNPLTLPKGISLVPTPCAKSEKSQLETKGK